MKTAVLVLTNAAMTVAWVQVLIALLQLFTDSTNPQSQTFPEVFLKPVLARAINVSFCEVFNAATGFTKAKPSNVIMFVVVRAGVEFLAAPMLPYNCWQHLLAALCWSCGEMVRFGCFTIDSLVGGSDNAKSIRYNVGPVAFACGTFGEWTMIITLALQNDDTRSIYSTMFLWYCVVSWPFGFSKLFRQLLKQRQKHFKALTEKLATKQD